MISHVQCRQILAPQQVGTNFDRALRDKQRKNTRRQQFTSYGTYNACSRAATLPDLLHPSDIIESRNNGARIFVGRHAIFPRGILHIRRVVKSERASVITVHDTYVAVCDLKAGVGSLYGSRTCSVVSKKTLAASWYNPRPRTTEQTSTK